jgi:hypothetical protein
MVEIMEYILVFAVTATLAGFSLLVLQGSLPVLDKTQGQSEFNQLSGAAGVAAIEGSSELVLPLSNASVGCSSGTISFSSGGLSYSSYIGYPCDFGYAGLSGVCKFVFSRATDEVSLQVAC